jgi:hypothetical protein
MKLVLRSSVGDLEVVICPLLPVGHSPHHSLRHVHVFHSVSVVNDDTVDTYAYVSKSSFPVSISAYPDNVPSKTLLELACQE